jgi:hypothetical protein
MTSGCGSSWTIHEVAAFAMPTWLPLGSRIGTAADAGPWCICWMSLKIWSQTVRTCGSAAFTPAVASQLAIAAPLKPDGRLMKTAPLDQ